LKQNILDFSKEELTQIIKPSFRAKQIYDWIYHKYVDDFHTMENLPKKLREELDEKYTINPLTIANKEASSDGTIKYLFALPDGRTVETVLLKMKEAKYNDKGELVHHAKYTICTSTQVGCKVGCTFCFTAKGGFIRDLSAGEIVGQVLAIKKERQIDHNRRGNIVYMGMGEPLDNFDNLVKAIDIFSDQEGLAISPKRQTVSTSGLSSKIDKLGLLDTGVNLAISLHAVDDDLRTELIPMNKAHNIASIIDAVRRFPINERKRVMFEYLMIKDKNDDIASAKKLIKLLDGIKAKINLIYFNPHEGADYGRPSVKSMEAFNQYLLDHGQLSTIRASKGIDISAACGQLREKEKSA
jgi:23S rRNA (adenine2503-C2)-methyltransferase